MNIGNPHTWDRFESHPIFKSQKFDPNWRDWYEGADPDEDLSILKSCAIEIANSLRGVSLILVVLDDLTTFVDFHYPPVVGRFGMGTNDRELYLRLDADPDVVSAPEVEIENIAVHNVIGAVKAFLAENNMQE